MYPVCLLLSLLEHPSQLVIESPIGIEIPGNEGSHHVSLERSDFLSVRARMNLDPLPRMVSAAGRSVRHGKCPRQAPIIALPSAKRPPGTVPSGPHINRWGSHGSGPAAPLCDRLRLIRIMIARRRYGGIK